MKIESEFFGKSKEGHEVKKYILTNDLGNTVGVLNYGGIICEIKVPDKNRIIKNVVLGHYDISGYENQLNYFGCITGRIAGRTSNASIKIGDTVYPLSKNDGNNHLHGGFIGFDKVIWAVEERIDEDSIGLTLSYLSPHLEEGYPGNLKVRVTYKWTNDNQLIIQYRAQTDQETPIVLTNHSYFNLSGYFTQNILDHELEIAADQFIGINQESIPCCILPVEGTPFDFRVPKPVGQDILSHHDQIFKGKGYDHPFILNENTKYQASLTHPESGRRLTVTTDEKCIVCYTGNYLDSEMVVYDQIPIQQRSGICFEAQYYPDAMNFELVPSRTLKPSETYQQTTCYQFSIV